MDLLRIAMFPVLLPLLTHKSIPEPNCTFLTFRQVFCDDQADLFLVSIKPGNKREQWIAESLGLPYQMFLLLSAKELLNRSNFGINSVICVCNSEQELKNEKKGV